MGFKSYHIVLMIAVVCIACACTTHAQQLPTFNRCFYNPPRAVFSKINYDALFNALKHNEKSTGKSTHTNAIPAHRMHVSPQGGMAGWGWFCRAEHRFRQTTKVPLFVRLGSVEQAKRLEGK